MSDVVCDSTVRGRALQTSHHWNPCFPFKKGRGACLDESHASSHLICRLYANIYLLPSPVRVRVNALHERNASSSLPFPVCSRLKKKNKNGESHDTRTNWKNLLLLQGPSRVIYMWTCLGPVLSLSPSDSPRCVVVHPPTPPYMIVDGGLIQLLI